MVYPEFSWTSREEYAANEPKRVNELLLHEGDLCTVMFSLKRNRLGREAAVSYAKIENAHATRTLGVYAVGLTLLSGDFEDQAYIDAHFKNGYWLEVNKQIRLKTPSRRRDLRPNDAYIAAYDDDFEEQPWRKISESKELVITSSETGRGSSRTSS